MESSFTFINLAAKDGFITNATNRDDDRTTIKVYGRNFINSPIIPGQRANGMNAARVVAVEVIIGIATSAAPNFAAWIGVCP